MAGGVPYPRAQAWSLTLLLLRPSGVCLLRCPSAWHIRRPSKLPYVSWGNLPSEPTGTAVKVKTMYVRQLAQGLLLFLLPQSQLKGGRPRLASCLTLESSCLKYQTQAWIPEQTGSLGSGSGATNERAGNSNLRPWFLFPLTARGPAHPSPYRRLAELQPP